MPQMMPMSWLNLFLIFFLCSVVSLSFFFTLKSYLPPKKHTINLDSPLIYWLW